MKKKVLSLVLALLMTASAASTVLANDDVMAISEDTAVEAVAVDEEVEAGQYDKAIEFLANYKIFKGYNADDTGADDPIERYQMALFVARISTGWVEDEVWEDGPENWSEFSDIDVDPVNKYYGALSYANQKGIIEGYGNGKFGPQDHITYQNALTMVVRTLGYTNLDWPWGYIQKAVELGLTDGITGVAYTDELTRGEVAQIIYNALFATTKSGTTLGLSSFGIEFGWEKIIVTASDLNTFVADKEDAEKKLKDDKITPYWDKSNKPASGFVTFQILNDDGSLADDVYYVQAADLGLAGDHDDEAAVGEAYYVLFEKDEDSNLAKVVAYESLKVDTIWNEGKTDNDGDEQDYAIQEFLDDYALVSKYTGNNYVNVTASTDLEMMVFAANGVLTEKTINGNLVAIDWETGDILVPADVNEDGKINEKDQDKDGNYKYVIEWYYNPVTEKYWNYQYDKKYENVIGIDKMTEKEFSDTYAKYFTYKDHEYKGFAATVDKIATSAYASLEIFDTNLDGVADRGIYESYRLGYFYEDKTSDSKSYRIDKVNAFDLAKDAAEADDSYSVTNIATFNTIQEGIKDGDVADRAWFVEGFEPEIAYDEDGEATGYKKGYVIYNYDAETGAIKVVKCIEDGTDEDSYVAKGVLRAYNLNNGTITIGEETFDVDNYNELEGNAFKYVTKKFATKACYTAKLRSLFNQFVEYVVVDGELVNISAVKASTSAVIVIDSYAGLSSDGYILVKGYHTDTLEYDTFRIGSYNGWEKGDYYYWLDEDTAKESFTKGAIYTIGSYDETEDVYYVNLAGEFDWNRKGEAISYTVEEGVALNPVTIKADGDKYLSYTTYKADGSVDKTYEDVKMKDTDKYVIIEKATQNKPYASIIVYEGTLPAQWSVTGDRINSSDRTNKLYVIVNATTVGFNDTYKSGLVVVLDGAYLEADYNGANAEGWYALGSTEYVVGVVDLLTGNLEATAAGTNVSVDEGHIYYTQSGVITEDKGMLTANTNAVVTMINNAYADQDTYFARTMNDFPAKYYTTKDDAHKKAIETDLVAPALGDKYRGDKIGDVSYRVIEFKKGEVEDIYAIDADKIDGLKTKNNITVLPAFYVYDVESKNIVFYLVKSDATVVTTGVETLGEKFDVVVLDDAKIVGQLIYTETTTTVGDVSTTVQNILGVRYEFVGEAVEGIHAKMLEKGYFFGTKGDHFAEAYKVTYQTKLVDKVDDAEIVYGTIVADEYFDCADAKADCDGCDAVKAIEVRFKKGDELVINFVDDAKTADSKLDYVDYYNIWINIYDLEGTQVFASTVENDVDNYGTKDEKYVGAQTYDDVVLTATNTVVGDTYANSYVAFVPGGMVVDLISFSGTSLDTVIDGVRDILD